MEEKQTPNNPEEPKLSQEEINKLVAKLLKEKEEKENAKKGKGGG